jgi:hypothetical protein
MTCKLLVVGKGGFVNQITFNIIRFISHCIKIILHLLFAYKYYEVKAFSLQ